MTQVFTGVQGDFVHFELHVTPCPVVMKPIHTHYTIKAFIENIV